MLQKLQEVPQDYHNNAALNEDDDDVSKTSNCTPTSNSIATAVQSSTHVASTHFNSFYDEEKRSGYSNSRKSVTNSAGLGTGSSLNESLNNSTYGCANNDDSDGRSLQNKQHSGEIDTSTINNDELGESVVNFLLQDDADNFLE